MVCSGDQSLSCTYILLGTHAWTDVGRPCNKPKTCCCWRGWLRAVNTESCSSGCRDINSAISEGGGLDERKQGFISSCVLPFCRMIRQSSLSRFPSHPLSHLSEHKLFARVTAQWKTVPIPVGSSFTGSCRYYHKANSSTPALEAVSLLTSLDQIWGLTWGRR